MNLVLKAFLSNQQKVHTGTAQSTIPQFNHCNFSFFHLGKSSAFVINFWHKLYHLKYVLRN